MKNLTGALHDYVNAPKMTLHDYVNAPKMTLHDYVNAPKMTLHDYVNAPKMTSVRHNELDLTLMKMRSNYLSSSNQCLMYQF
jgi:hypothetical protein